jgi:MYXO-CTERM domain-containing protein
MRTAILSLAVLLLAAPEAAAVPYDHLQTTDDIGPNKIPHMGTSHILVIPSRVGPGAFPTGIWTELERFFKPEGGDGTFRQFWQIVSNGKYDPIPTLLKPVMFPDECPVEGKTIDKCTIKATMDDIPYLINGAVAAGMKKIIERARDQQQLDLRQYDINSGTAQKPDGYLDGVIIDSDIYSGLALPLSALGTPLTIPATGPDDKESVKLGIVALTPPYNHEFSHMFGLIDLYGGPTVNDLQCYNDLTPSAFTLQQLGWTEVIKVTGPGTHTLKPLLGGGSVLRIGDWGDRYLMIENRGGPYHNKVGQEGNAGLYIYSIDQSTLPTSDLGFLNLGSTSLLYLPNGKAPYLCVNLPLYCALTGFSKPCALQAAGDEIRLLHAAGNDTGLAVRVETVAASGEITLAIRSAPPLDAGPPDVARAQDLRSKDARRREGSSDGGGGCGCALGGGPATSPGALLLGLVGGALFRRRRPARRR